MIIFDLAVIGAGVIGLSIAKFYSALGYSVVVLEKESRAGEGISSRNSGVIHAGMYYPTNSLKTKFCIEGNKMLYEYATLKNITHKKLGKYIIASQVSELGKLDKIYEQGISNGAKIKRCSKDEMQAKYPDLIVAGGIYSSETGIIDVPEFITALEGDIQHNGGTVAFNTSFKSAAKVDNLFEIICDNGNEFMVQAKNLVNAAGLTSDLSSRNIKQLDKKYNHPIHFAKGHYFKYSGSHPFHSLVYPLSDEFSLGIHVGFDISGQLRFGPDLTWVQSLDFSFDESLKEKFIAAIHSYWPNMDPEKLQPDYVGIRPKIQNSKQSMQDFLILGRSDHGVRGLITLQGIESPGVTSSLAIGDYVASMIELQS